MSDPYNHIGRRLRPLTAHERSVVSEFAEAMREKIAKSEPDRRRQAQLVAEARRRIVFS